MNTAEISNASYHHSQVDVSSWLRDVDVGLRIYAESS
jgi:hypothetical protein